VHWQPPQKALDKVKDIVWDPIVSSYGPDEGIPELRHALQIKVNNHITPFLDINIVGSFPCLSFVYLFY